MRRLTTISLTSLALVLGACSPGLNKSVAQSSDLVLVSLSQMSPQTDVMDMAKQFPNTAYQMSQTADGVTWTFMQNGAEACRFTAKVTAKDAKSSRVTTSLEDLSKGGERYLCNVVKIVGEESVAAAVDGRLADRAKVKTQLARYLVSDFGAMTESVSKRMTEMAPPSGDPCPGMMGPQRDNCETAAAIRRQNHEKTQAELDRR
jgi:hypothetical protein